MKDTTFSRDPLEREFIRLLTDFGFKRVFGSRKRSGILKRFLNALFEGEMVIKEITYRDKEILADYSHGKRVLYDIFCTTDTGKHFIIEMQQEESENFSDRILFYVCKAIVNQGMKGVEYELEPVYCVVLTNFNMSRRKVRLIKEMVLYERHTQELYTENIKIIFIALPEVPKKWEECETELIRLLYLIKNMENLTKESKPYLSGEYQELFDASATESLTREEAVAYSASYLKEKESESAVRFAAKTNREEGRAEGIKEGRMKGKKEGMIVGALEKLKEVVYNMRKNGCSNAMIAQLLNESPEVIDAI